METQPRENDGRFGRKAGSAPEVELLSPRELAGKLRSLSLQLEREVPGLMLGTGVDSDARGFELRCIALQDRDQGQGKGTMVMGRLVDFADERGLSIRLTPSDVYGGDVERLHVFYERHGFVPLDDEQLIREPYAND